MLFLASQLFSKISKIEEATSKLLNSVGGNDHASMCASPQTLFLFDVSHRDEEERQEGILMDLDIPTNDVSKFGYLDGQNISGPVGFYETSDFSMSTFIAGNVEQLIGWMKTFGSGEQSVTVNTSVAERGRLVATEA